MRILVLAVICFCGLSFATTPMETLERYNVILVHGAAPEKKGFASKCETGSISDAYSLLISDDYNKNSLKKLTYWLDSAVFEEAQEVKVVDKIITLDSPHEGTGAFAVLNPNGEGFRQILL